ncbi:hypothetical protein [Nocardia sp. NPDC003345]
MDAWIIVAVVLVAAGLLVSLFVWWRNPGSGNSEYVTVAELQARLDHEHDDSGDPTDSGPDHPAAASDAGTAPAATDDSGTTDRAEPGTVAADDEAAGSGQEPRPEPTEPGDAGDEPDDVDTAGKAPKPTPEPEPGHDH